MGMIFDFTVTGKVRVTMSKRTKPECLVATIFLASRVDKCNPSDIKKLRRLFKYLRSTAGQEIALEIVIPGGY